MAVATLFGSQAQAQKASEQKPLWQEDPRQFGLPDPSNTSSSNRISVSRGSLGFLNNDTLILSWVTPDEPLPKLPKRTKFAPLPVVPSHLHIVFIDAQTGEKTKEHNLSVPSAPISLYFTHAGNLLVRAGDSVDLYSPDLAHLGQSKFPLPLDSKSSNSASDIKISPDGRRILLCSDRGLSAESEILNSEDLQPLVHLPEMYACYSTQLGNDFVLFHAKKADSNQIQILRNGQESRPLVIPTADTQSTGPLHSLQVLNGDAFVAFMESQIEICTEDGKLLFTDTLPKRHDFWPGATARDSDRFVLMISHLRGWTIPAWDLYASPWYNQVAVYGIAERKVIFATKLKGSWNYLWCALSPNGSLLAISSKTSIEIYRLP